MAHLGMRGTGDWVANQRPENWRQTILYLYPNGMAPLTAILSMMGSEKTDDPHFHWWTETIGDVNGTVSGVYTDAAMSTAYTSGGTSGDVLYLKVAENLAKQIRTGHQLLLRDQSDYSVDVNAEVVSVILNGSSSVIGAKLLEDDDNSSSHDLSDCDHLKVIGNINAEGAEMPDAIARDPVEHYNYTQIWRAPLSITRTARLTKLRTENDYQKMKREALEIHSIEMENSLMWGIRTISTGANGKPKRTTMGIVPWIRENAPSNVDDYTLNATYSGQSWTTGGETWFKTMLEQIFRYGSSEKLAFVGSGALLGIDALAMAGGQLNLQPAQKTYGMQIHRWITPFGTLSMKTHPLFSYDATTRNMMVIFEPKDLKFRYVTDTTFYPDKERDSRNGKRVDATVEEFLTEGGLEFHFPEKCGILNGVGLDNNLT